MVGYPILLILLFILSGLLIMLHFGIATRIKAVWATSLLAIVIFIFLSASWFYFKSAKNGENPAYSVKQPIHWEESQYLFLQGVERLGNYDSTGCRDHQKALLFFDQAIEMNPAHVEAKYWKVHCEINLRHLDQALNTAESAIGNCKNNPHRLLPELYVLAGAIEREQGNRKEAIQYWNQAAEIYQLRIKSETNNVNAMVNKAIVLCYLDRKKEALRFIETQLTGKEQSLIFHQTREWIAEFKADNVLGDVMGRAD